MSAGSLVVENGKAALDFDADPDTILEIADNGNLDSVRTGAFSYIASAKLRVRSSSWQAIFTPSANNNGEGALGLQFYSNTAQRFGPHNSWVAVTAVASVYLTDQTRRSIFSLYRDNAGTNGNGSNVQAFVTDSEGNVFNNSETQPWVSNTGTLATIGKQGEITYASTQSWVGTIQELLIYPTDQSAKRQQIESNINTYYGIY